jgi:hypothetical protein
MRRAAHAVESRSLSLFFGRGFHYRPSSAARPPKKHGPASRRRPRPTKRGVCCASLPAALLPVDATHVAAVYPQHPSCYLRQAPPPSPDPLACDLQLASVAVSAARRDSASSHPGRAHFSLPRRTCVWRKTATSAIKLQEPRGINTHGLSAENWGRYQQEMAGPGLSSDLVKATKR